VSGSVLCVRLSILSLFSIFLLDFGTVLTVWYILFFILIYLDETSGCILLLLNYLAVKHFTFDRTWWTLFQKRVVRTKFDIYVFYYNHLRNNYFVIFWLSTCRVFYLNCSLLNHCFQPIRKGILYIFGNTFKFIH